MVDRDEVGLVYYMWSRIAELNRPIKMAISIVVVGLILAVSVSLILSNPEFHDGLARIDAYNEEQRRVANATQNDGGEGCVERQILPVLPFYACVPR